MLLDLQRSDFVKNIIEKQKVRVGFDQNEYILLSFSNILLTSIKGFRLSR